MLGASLLESLQPHEAPLWLWRWIMDSAPCPLHLATTMPAMKLRSVMLPAVLQLDRGNR